MAHTQTCPPLAAQVSYAIGVPEPLSVFVDSYGTGTISDADILAKGGWWGGRRGVSRKVLAMY